MATFIFKNTRFAQGFLKKKDGYILKLNLLFDFFLHFLAVGTGVFMGVICTHQDLAPTG